MGLPLELRRYFYNLILPSQDVPRRSSEWANTEGTPNQCMNILLANKQISEEARSVLYGLNSFTIVVSENATFLPRSRSGLDFQPMLTTLSLGYIKNWQLSVPLGRYDEHNDYVRDALLSACAQLANIPILQTLKISVPYLCGYVDRDCGYNDNDCMAWRGGGADVCRCIDIEDIHEGIVYSLAPLN